MKISGYCRKSNETKCGFIIHGAKVDYIERKEVIFQKNVTPEMIFYLQYFLTSSNHQN